MGKGKKESVKKRELERGRNRKRENRENMEERKKRYKEKER